MSQINQVECAIPGCEQKAYFRTKRDLSPKVRLICKGHSIQEQLQVVGRSYDPSRDERDKDLHFQEHQFDKDLKRSARPIGTSHIHSQGSDIMDAEEILLAGGIHD